MNPDLPRTPGGPAPAASNPLAAGGLPVPSQPEPQHLSAAQQATARAKKLIEEHQNNPFLLNQELDKLKSEYLANEFHITITAADD